MAREADSWAHVGTPSHQVGSLSEREAVVVARVQEGMVCAQEVGTGLEDNLEGLEHARDGSAGVVLVPVHRCPWVREVHGGGQGEASHPEVSSL